MRNLASFTILLAASFLIGARPAPDSESDKRESPPFAVGEKLVYNARVWKGLSFIGLSVGEATLQVKKSDRAEWPGAYRIMAKAKGGAFGYKARVTVQSYVDRDTLLPVHATVTQRGSEVQDKKLVFANDEALYVKKKHCKQSKTCATQEHFVSEKISRGFLRGYDRVRRHCRLRRCEARKHYVWRIRDRHKVDRPTYDMLSVIYICRTLDLPLKGKGQELRIVDAHDQWDVTIRAVAREKIEVPAGKFRCLRIEISPKPAEKGTKVRKEFRGLFGIHGDIQIWIDEKTRIPVRIRGVVPFGVDLNMEVSLAKKTLPQLASRTSGS